MSFHRPSVTPPVTLKEVIAGLRARYQPKGPLLPVPVPMTWVGRLLRLLDRRPEEPIRRVRNLDDLHGLLLELWDYMDGCADVKDGPDGQPQANTEMRFMAEIDSAILFVLEQEAPGLVSSRTVIPMPPRNEMGQ